MSIKEKLESLGRNSIQLKIARKETYKLGATRFGGKPDVPPDFVWPTYEGESYDHVVTALVALIQRLNSPFSVRMPFFSIARTVAPSWTVGRSSTP